MSLPDKILDVLHKDDPHTEVDYAPLREHGGALAGRRTVGLAHRRRPRPRVNRPRSSRVTDVMIALAVGFPPVPGSTSRNGD